MWDLAPRHRLQLAERLREAAATLTPRVGAGEFHNPLNPRRLRLLAERVAASSAADRAREDAPRLHIDWSEPGAEAISSAEVTAAAGSIDTAAAARDSLILAVATRAALSAFHTGESRDPPASLHMYVTLPGRSTPDASTGGEIVLTFRDELELRTARRPMEEAIRTLVDASGIALPDLRIRFESRTDEAGGLTPSGASAP